MRPNPTSEDGQVDHARVVQQALLLTSIFRGLRLLTRLPCRNAALADCGFVRPLPELVYQPAVFGDHLVAENHHKPLGEECSNL